MEIIWAFLGDSPRTMINAGGLVIHEKKKPSGGEGFSEMVGIY